MDRPAETTTDELERLEADCRARQAAIEAQRYRDGGIYDPILKRWVPIDE